MWSNQRIRSIIGRTSTDGSAITTAVGRQRAAQILKCEFQCRNGSHSSGRTVGFWNAMITRYAQRGRIEDARHVFDKTPQRTVVSWNAMLAGYVQNGQIDDACHMFGRMPERNVFSWTMMIAGYGQNGRIEDAWQLFNKMPERDIVSWNAMLTVCVQNGRINDARHLFDEMPERNVESWNAMLTGYGQNGMMEDAHQLFHNMPTRNVISWTAMITGYLHSFRMDIAWRLFEEAPKRTVVSWNAMISGFAQKGHCEEALKLFSQMLGIGMKPNHSTFLSVLSACATIASLQHGRQVHTHIIKRGLVSNVSMGNALITMFAKCGSMHDACSVFDKMPATDVVSWNAMIAACAQHGHGEKALRLFEQMQGLSTTPDEITFIGVLSACSHAGLVDDGWHYFDAMSQDYFIMPKSEHYACMVDLLGRSGLLDEAEKLIDQIPFEPVAVVWKALLGACRIHVNVEVGKRAAEHLFELEPQNSAAYVLLSNIYAVAGRWDDVAKVRIMMKEKGIKKLPGCSWIELKNKVHAFVVGDRSHPQTEKIYSMLERLAEQMEDAGYVPDMNFALHDVQDEQKKYILCHHSEKLAIAFGLISTPHGMPIMIFNNLRMCANCHTVTKFICKIVGREIIVRDTNRFHNFKDGICSCGDFW